MLAGLEPCEYPEIRQIKILGAKALIAIVTATSYRKIRPL